MDSEKIEPPKIYAEWIELLGLLKKKSNDIAVLCAMKQGTLEWQTGVAERFAKRLIDTINSRMNNATDKFQTEMNRANGQERSIVLALLALRKEMSFLAEAIDLPVIPEKDRQHYQQLVMDQANHMQQSLEESAKHDRSGKLISIVRNNKVNEF